MLVTEQQRAAEALRYMQDTEGWKLLEQFIRGRIEDSKGRLMTCELEDVIRHRHEAKALEAVLIYMEQTIQEGLEESN